jgi:arylsulfatase A-like enzyme
MRGMRIGMICCLLATSGFAAEPHLSIKGHPDVFLVTIDTLRADHIHCYGDNQIQTPALDALAKDGVRFANVFTPSPITNTSHASILTGLLPGSHGVTDFAMPLSEAHITWAELLRQRGYYTAAFIGAVILDSNTLAPGFNRGFDFYDNFPEHPNTKARWGRLERRGKVVVEHAETWLNKSPAGPTFFWLHLYDPHDPYEPPPPFSQIYKDRLYDGEISYADSALADFIGFLKRRNRYDNSLIIVVGDHGEGLGEHHEETHGMFLYDSTTHVPLIIKLPSHRYAGRVVDAQVRTTDILPTVLDLLHFSTSHGFDGKSLRSYFARSEVAGRPAFGETDYPLHFGWAPLRSIRAEGFKLIQAPRPEFYDLHTDPKEQRDLYTVSNEDVQRFHSILDKLGVKFPLPAPPSDDSQLPDPKDKIDEQNLLHTAMLSQDDNHPEMARETLRKVLQLDPHSWVALRTLGELELKAGHYSEAADHLRSANEVHPGEASVAFEGGQALAKLGDIQGARDLLETSLKLMPDQFQARLLLGDVYLDLKDPELAGDQFEAALLLQPKSAEARLGLASALIAGGQFADAVDQLKTAAESHPGNAKVFESLAEVYHKMGNQEESQKAKKKAEYLSKN